MLHEMLHDRAKMFDSRRISTVWYMLLEWAVDDVNKQIENLEKDGYSVKLETVNKKTRLKLACFKQPLTEEKANEDNRDQDRGDPSIESVPNEIPGKGVNPDPGKE